MTFQRWKVKSTLQSSGEAKLADAEAERDRLHDGMQKCAVCKDYSPSDFEAMKMRPPRPSLPTSKPSSPRPRPRETSYMTGCRSARYDKPGLQFGSNHTANNTIIMPIAKWRKKDAKDGIAAFRKSERSKSE